MNWLYTALISMVAAAGSIFGIHQDLQIVATTTSMSPVQQTVASTSYIVGIPTGWKTYQDTGWGFQISYPPNMRFVSNMDNLNGPTHYIISQQPYTQSGYSGKLLEIADMQGTSTLKGYLQVTFIPIQPDSLNTLDKYVQSIVATSTDLNAKNGISVTFKHFTINGINLPAIVHSSATGSNNQGTYVYYYVASSTIFGKTQPSKVFRIEYAPVNSGIFQQIASTMKTIPVIPSDDALYYSATDGKDASWCSYIQNSELKTQCYIAVRGHPIIDKYPVSLGTIAAQNGNVKFIGTSTVVLTATKTANATSGVAWVSLIETPTTPWNMLNIQPVFTNGKGSEGLLTIIWDTQTIGQDDGRLADEMSIVGGYGAMYLGTSTYASHILGLRLDTFGTSTGSVSISNITAEVVH